MDADLLAVLREQGSRRHDEILEWIGEFVSVNERLDTNMILQSSC